jgi:hypothetical protein
VGLSGGGDGPAVVMAEGGRELSLRWQANLPKPTMAGDTATHAEVLSEGRSAVAGAAAGVSEPIKVKTRQAASSSALSKIRFDVGGKGLTLRADAEGVLTAVDAGGGRVLSSLALMMWDAQGAGKAAGSDSALPPSGLRHVGIQADAGITLGLKAADEGEPLAWRKCATGGTYAPRLNLTYNHRPNTPVAQTMSASNSNRTSNVRS